MSKRQLTLFGTQAGLNTGIYSKKPSSNFELFMNKFMKLNDFGDKKRQTIVNEGIECWKTKYKG